MIIQHLYHIYQIQVPGIILSAFYIRIYMYTHFILPNYYRILLIMPILQIKNLSQRGYAICLSPCTSQQIGLGFKFRHQGQYPCPQLLYHAGVGQGELFSSARRDKTDKTTWKSKGRNRFTARMSGWGAQKVFASQILQIICKLIFNMKEMS